jgi:hypothetical protein
MQVRTLLLVYITLNVISAQSAEAFTHDPNPPYSNSNYSCRCIPILDENALYDGVRSSHDIFAVHRKLCELKSYVREFIVHTNFLRSCLDGTSQDIEGAIKKLIKQADYATEKEKGLGQDRNALRSNIGSCMKQLPDNYFKSFTVRTIKAELMTGKLSTFDACEKALIAFINGDAEQLKKLCARDIAGLVFDPSSGDFASERLLYCVYTVFKELNMLILFAHRFLVEKVLFEYFVTQPLYDREGIELYLQQAIVEDSDKLLAASDYYRVVDAQSIDLLLKKESLFFTKFMHVLTKLSQNTEGHFVGWLKNIWSKASPGVGVFIVRAVQYYWNGPRYPFYDDTSDDVNGLIFLGSTQALEQAEPLFKVCETARSNQLHHSSPKDGYVQA